MAPREVSLFQVDAFTDVPFAGNPAAVCLLDGPAPDPWMASVAAEMNLAETAFSWPEGDSRRLRWFTPAVEVDLCGHATLATAHVLWHETGASDPVLSFSTASGVLTAEAAGDRIRLDLPAAPRSPAPPDLVDRAARAIGAPVADAAVFGPNLLVELPDPATLRGLTPDIGAIAELDVHGLLVTSPGDGFDYLVRYFAPRVGIAEDPVTGSAQCAAGPWWAARTGRTELTSQQASPRSGRLWVDVAGDRVGVAGRAVTVLEGRLR